MRIKPVENLYFGAYLPHKQEPQELDYSKIDDVVIENIDHNDYPDFCDAYVASAWYDDNGNYRELTQSELENLDSEWVSEQVWDWIH
jgi:hypothetical protein